VLNHGAILENLRGNVWGTKYKTRELDRLGVKWNEEVFIIS